MKKISKYGAIFVMAAMVMLTSCLDGGKNSASGVEFGVARFEMKTMKMVLDIPDGTLYSEAFQNLNEGACCWVQFDIDYDAPENSSDMVSALGYYTVTVTSKEEIDKYMASNFLTDTARVQPNEIAVVNPVYNIYRYVKNNFFIGQVLQQPTDQKYQWSLSYNGQNMSKEENGQNVYDVYVRAMVVSPSSKSPEDKEYINAYDMGNYLNAIAQTEKNLSKSYVYIRFNYVSEIKDDVLIWKQSEKQELPIAAFISTAQ
jgi:hypothetical protein